MRVEWNSVIPNGQKTSRMNRAPDNPPKIWNGKIPSAVISLYPGVKIQYYCTNTQFLLYDELLILKLVVNINVASKFRAQNPHEKERANLNSRAMLLNESKWVRFSG